MRELKKKLLIKMGAHTIHQASKIISQHILMVVIVTNVNVPTRTTDDAPLVLPNAPPPLTHISRRMSRNADACRIIIVTGPVAERDQATALSRTTSDTATARKTFILTAHEINMLQGTHHRCHGISSHIATKQLRSLERRIARGYLSFSYDCYTSPIYKSVKLSNVASSLSHRPSRSTTKQLRPLEQRATPRLPERSHNIYFA